MAALIAQHFGITYCPSGVWRLLRRMGWSAQKPTRRARERDDHAIDLLHAICGRPLPAAGGDP